MNAALPQLRLRDPSETTRASAPLPPEQVAVRERCRHPSGTYEAFPADALNHSLPDRFREVVARHGARQALVTDQHRWTYAELDHHANRLAQAVLHERDRRTEPVVLLMDKGAPAIAAILGVLKAGKIAVPLDPAQPDARLADLLSDLGAGLIITDHLQVARARTLPGAVLPVIDAADLGGAAPAADPRLALPADTLAYLLFTSGSTGRPKALVHDHHALLHLIWRLTPVLRLCPEDATTLLASLSTGQATFEMFMALLNGATLCPRDLRREGMAGLADWMRAEHITYYRSSVSVYRQWVKQLGEGERFPDLRMLKIGGEPVLMPDVSAFRERFPTTPVLFNALSSTETWTTCVSAIGHETPPEGNVVAAGYPVDGVAVWLVRPQGSLATRGETGEMVVQSAGMARGYWRGGRVDASAFPPAPDQPAERVFRSGDLGIELPDGGFLHVGRQDGTLKIRGQRLDVSEVEAALRERPDVRQAVVVAQEEGSGEQRLVGYVVPRGEQPPTRGELRAFLAGRLPDYMVPGAFVMLMDLPLTPSGKIERRALPRYRPPAPSDGDSSAASATTFGAQLCAIWEDVLGITGVGLRDDFVDLGGNSLLALTMALRIEQCCGQRIAFSRLLEGITIERLMDVLLEGESANFGKPLIALQPAGARKPLFWLHGDFERGGIYSHNLSRLLGNDQPFYAVTPHGLDGGDLPWSIEDMARERLSALREIQPHGPYRLGGLCAGGVVAFEMARQLRDLGEPVEVVLVVDARAINAPWPYRTVAAALRIVSRALGWDETRRRRAFLGFRMHLQAFRDSARPGGGGRLRFLVGKCAAVVRRIAGLMPRSGPASVSNVTSAAEANGSLTQAEVYWARFCAYGERLDAYVPPRVDVPVVLFRSSHLDDRPPGGWAAGWDRLSSKVTVHHLPGNHQTCLTRHVAVLAVKLRAHLD